MSRQAREISRTGIYHVVYRGINRQDIFEENKDFEKKMEILDILKKEMNFEIYAYCFMTNHVHILIKESAPGDISLIMKRLLTKYAMWYNRKYQRSGALIANRYKSKPVEVDEYFLPLVRYIHQNPLKAGIVDKIEDYKWSSYREYYMCSDAIADKEFVSEMLPAEEFIKYHQIEETECFFLGEKTTVSDEEIRRIIIKKYDIEPNSLAALDKEKRNKLLHKFKKEFSIRQIERVTGIARGVVQKV